MKELNDNIVYFLENQGFVIVSTLDEQGGIHCSAKGIVGIEKEGRVYLIDIYRARTLNNLKRSSTVSITAIDGHKFAGYTLQGKAKIVERSQIKEHIITEWEERVTRRISQRMLKNIKEEKPSGHHPEASFPRPQYLIEVDVEKIIDLAPANMKNPAGAQEK